MFTVQNYRSALWNSYPATLAKQGAIAAAAGYLYFFSSSKLELASICKSSTSELSNYLCLRSTTFFDQQNLVAFFFKPLSAPTLWIEGIVKPYIPDFHFTTKNCHVIYELLEIMDRHLGLNQLLDYPLIKAHINRRIEKICRADSDIISSVFSEELIFRFGIQKVALLSLAKFFPDRIGKFFTHPATRILITSFIFAFSHLREELDGFVIPQFIGGLIYGVIFEKYGLLASTVSHYTSTLSLYHSETNRWKNHLFSEAKKLGITT